MNIDEYESKYFLLYEDFAETARFILKKALAAAEELPRPQSIQYRAKGRESLRSRLVEAGTLESQVLEQDRRDLAGVRIIFYTNNDVERFLASSLIRENFEIEVDSTKIHHPTAENKGARYRGIHYTVRLREDRVRLPEYARFSGLRCEIQVQTVLNHAWSETSHDTLYKNKLSDGYGKKAMEGIARRFERIMDRYLIPAGYEIQKAQQEYERVRQGKELFDKDIVRLLNSAQNNNERYEILSGLKDYAIPNYDDLPAAYEELKAPLLRAVHAARVAEPIPIETAFGNMVGFKAEAISKLVVEIVESLSYVDAVGTLQLLIDIFRDEQNGEIGQKIISAVKNLSEYNIGVYEQVGPMLQIALVDHLATISDADIDSIRAVALAVWAEVLGSDISGTEWKADSVILSSGAVPASEQLMEVRDKAIKALFAAYDRSTDDAQKRAVLSALDAATRTPSRADCPDELLVVTLRDAARVVEFMTERAKATSYELLQHLEHQYLYDYFRVKKLAEEQGNATSRQADAAVLVASIYKFRDRINSDETFVRYKVLVGFESVFPMHWDDETYDYQAADEYRHKEVDRYIEEINAQSEGSWFELASRCAETRSNDLATFPVFGDFITKLAQRKPEVADRFLAKAGDDLRGFLAGFLNGLAASNRQDIYERVLADELESARNLLGVVRHLRYSNVKQPEVASRLLKRAVDEDDTLTVMECLLFAMQHFGSDKIDDADAFVRDALIYLNERKDPRWVFGAWFAQRDTKFYEEVAPERVMQMLASLEYLPQVDHRSERVLARLAERHLEAVWDYFGRRLAQVDVKDGDREQFEAVPFRLHALDRELSKDPGLAISKGLAWFRSNSSLFEFRGGRLLSAAFPRCTDEFASALAGLVREGGETETDFALAILRNYRGETSTYAVLKEIVSRFPEDTRRIGGAQACIESTGVVHGDLGFANAWRAKKDSLADWLEDDRLAVRGFAEKEMANLDLMVASDERRAEEERRMRELSYSGDDEPDDRDARDEPPG